MSYDWRSYYSDWWSHKGKEKEEKDWTSYSTGSRYKSSLGYGSGRLLDTTTSWTGSWYSSYSSVRNKEDKNQVLLTKAYKEARDLVVVLDLPFKVKLFMGRDIRVPEGWRRVFLPTDPIRDTKLSESDQINTICGLGIHEASHLKYTQFSVIRDIDNVSRSYFTPLFNKHFSEHLRLVKAIFNVIEDERIEDNLLEERPGYLEFIKLAREWNKKRYNTALKSSDGDLRNDCVKVVNNLVRVIRFPDSVESSVLVEWEELFSSISEILSPFPTTTKGSFVAATKIVEKLISRFSESDIFNCITLIISALDSSYYEVLYGADMDSHKCCTDPSAFGDSISSLNTATDIAGGTLEKNGNIYFTKLVGSKTAYHNLVSEISTYIPAIQKLIKGADKNYDFTIHGCRTGLLDTNKLAEAYQGVPQVYLRTGHVTTNKSTVCVVVDESGSMSGRKERMARLAAVLLNEAIRTLPGVDLYIYGHTADTIDYGSTVINVYREGSEEYSRFALSECCARRENRDGVAFLEIAKRIRKRTSNHCLMFILSDGEPSAGDYRGREAILDTKAKVQQIRGMDFDPIQITIENFGSASELMFGKGNVINLSHGLSELPKLLSQIVKNRIVSDKKTVVS